MRVLTSQDILLDKTPHSAHMNQPTAIRILAVAITIQASGCCLGEERETSKRDVSPRVRGQISDPLNWNLAR